MYNDSREIKSFGIKAVIYKVERVTLTRYVKV